MLSKSKFAENDIIKTEIPIINLAFSGKIDGGITSGVSQIAGESRTFKTGILVQLAKAFQQKYKKGVVVFFDSEFSPKSYFDECDPDRIIHIPITNIEQLKHETVSILNDLGEDDKIIFLVDSLGGLGSIKEITDAEDGKIIADMSRAKSINSFFRIITPLISIKKICFIFINSHYETQEMYSKIVFAGGKKALLAADTAIFIHRQKEKEGKEVIGYNFVLSAEKSRFIKEGSKFALNVTHKDGINRYSGLFELAVESGHVIQSGAWFQTVDKNGELNPKKTRRKEIESKEFFENLIKNKDFKKFCSDKYLLS